MEWHQNKIPLGRGKDSPGIDLYTVKSGHVENILSLPYGQSIYALDVSPEGTCIAAGTKTGLLYLLIKTDESQSENNLKRFIQGEPVLSVCFIDELNIAACDSSGRCLIWQYTNSQPAILPAGKGVLCSMIRIDETHFAGLSTTGELSVWSLPDADCMQMTGVPPPPELSALVNLLYWQKENSLVFPSAGGDIAVYDMEHGDIKAFHAHEGDVYAMTLFDGSLLTFGMTDGRLRQWESGNDVPVAECRAPSGIISAVTLNESNGTILLIDEKGDAAVYFYAENNLDLVHSLPGGGYRAVYRPDIEKLKRIQKEANDRRARELAVQIGEAMSSGNGDTGRLYAELEDIGYGRVALALRAEESRRHNDLIGELKYYGQLVQLLPEQEPGSVYSLMRYAELLLGLWMPANAYGILKRLVESGYADRTAGDLLSMSEEYADAMAGNSCIIEGGINLSTVVQAATIMNEPFANMWLIKCLDPLDTSGIDIPVAELVERYGHHRKRTDDIALPGAVQKKLQWLSPERIEEADVVIFGDHDTGKPQRHYQFGIRSINEGTRSLLIPMVIFNPGVKMPESSAEMHNQKIADMFQREDSRLLGNSWLKTVHQAVNYAIRQLITRKKSTLMK